jgi:hypothetical protein
MSSTNFERVKSGFPPTFCINTIDDAKGKDAYDLKIPIFNPNGEVKSLDMGQTVAPVVYPGVKRHHKLQFAALKLWACCRGI